MGKKRSQSSTPAEQAAERLAVIVDAAERAALKVIDDAEKEAQRCIEDASARADRIVAEKLREAADQIERDAGGDDIPSPPRLRPVESPLEPAPERPGNSEGSAAARLLATQMAVSGSGREEIEQRLRTGFEIEDTSEILDAILGPEG